MAAAEVAPAVPARASRGRRLVRVLAIAFAIVAVMWTIAWFVLANTIERQFDERTTALARAAQADIACGRRGVSGYPFALVFACEEDVMVSTERADVALASLTARTSIVSPSQIALALEGPANLAFAPSLTVRAEWDEAAAVLDDAFDRRSLAFSFAGLRLAMPRLEAGADDLALSLAPSGRDLDIRLTGQGIAIAPEGRGEATMARLFGDVTLEGLHRRLLMAGRPFNPTNGLTGKIERLGLDTGAEGRFFLSGPFEVSPAGLLSGRFTIAVRDPDALQAMADALIGADERISGALSALAALGEPREIDGAEMRAIELTAVNGQVPFAFFTIDLPPLWRVPPA